MARSSMEMCERNHPGHVGSLLNPDALYLSNLRGHAAHMPGLHQLPYSAHPWTPSSSCGAAAPPAQARAFGGFCAPFASGGHVKAHLEAQLEAQLEEARCFQETSRKTEEPDGAYASEHALRGYSELDGSVTRLGPESAAPLNCAKQEHEPTDTASREACCRTTSGQG